MAVCAKNRYYLEYNTKCRSLVIIVRNKMQNGWTSSLGCSLIFAKRHVSEKQLNLKAGGSKVGDITYCLVECDSAVW